MRLLHTKDFVFRDFFDAKIPPYAILSHRWSDEEVSYRDFLEQKAQVLSGGYKGYGWTKILKACEKAWNERLDWVWIDTCCIDKSSSAELSEAINSMYKWYRGSFTCFVFLPDVHDLERCTCKLKSRKTHGETTFKTFYVEELKRSTWFTRAWTLQELLAPWNVLFYNADFRCVGTLENLAEHVSEASHIPMEFLSAGEVAPMSQRRFCPTPVHLASVAQRMGWAARRQASRSEDIAYSLLGIFDVNMPLLYGEGERKAFRRLQKEIIASSPDESIFCWSDEGKKYFEKESILAATPGCFASSTGVKFNAACWSGVEMRPRCEIFNRGIRFDVIMRTESPGRKGDNAASTRSDNKTSPRQLVDRFILPLNCSHVQSRGCFALLVFTKHSRKSSRDGHEWVLESCRTADLLYGPPLVHTARESWSHYHDYCWRSMKQNGLEVEGVPLAEQLLDAAPDTVSCQLYLEI
ncbi:uncharacterized protein LTR77_004599 [Saxophila tyrrhenica]|uniref:Heterokaryon incompatibility domain-containing protein n=1 Tax=Saxophila tyrrhenica TaxID=1690608 RepID=A0AAV9PD45_9PEZI|nr:hypothetical protein LTR77_004599 [Saxophila tyrrhenica]